MPESESEEESEDEEEAEIEEDESESDYDLSIDTQPLIKPTKKPKKTILKPDALEKPVKPVVKKSKRVPATAITTSTPTTVVTIPDDSPPPKKGRMDSTKEKDGKLSNQNSVSSKDGENRKKYVLFNDNNIDVNLHNEAPQNIKIKKIKLSHSLIVLCQMIEGVDMKGNFNNDFAAMTFQKKMKDGKAYEFSIPLALAPTLQNAAQIMIDANPQFFSGIRKFRE